MKQLYDFCEPLLNNYKVRFTDEGVARIFEKFYLFKPTDNPNGFNDWAHQHYFRTRFVRK